MQLCPPGVCVLCVYLVRVWCVRGVCLRACLCDFFVSVCWTVCVALCGCLCTHVPVHLSVFVLQSEPCAEDMGRHGWDDHNDGNTGNDIFPVGIANADTYVLPHPSPAPSSRVFNGIEESASAD